jgi:hypothetical protein
MFTENRLKLIQAQIQYIPLRELDSLRRDYMKDIIEAEREIVRLKTALQSVENEIARRERE